MGKKRPRLVLPPELPPEVPDDEIEDSPEFVDIRVAKESKQAEVDSKEGESIREDPALVKLTKSEKRLQQKKLRKEAKKQSKEEVIQTPQGQVLDEVKKDLTAEENNEQKKYKLAKLGTALLADPESNKILEISKDGDTATAMLGLKSLLDDDNKVDENFQLFSRKKKSIPTTTIVKKPPPSETASAPKVLEKELNPNPTPAGVTFSDLGLSQWAVNTCKELGMKRPTPVQYHCIPKILAGQDVMGLAETGSGKTAAFALPILNCLAENPFGVFALVVTPTRELAYQLAEQFRALGSGLGLRCSVIVGGMDMINQAQSLTQRPHVVITTPGRIKVLIEQNPDDIPAVFSNTKFLVLDEADRVLGVNFEEELRVIFQCLPKKRQTLLFTATMTSNLKTLLELSANKAYFYEPYDGFKTVESLKQQYVFIPKNVKDVYLLHILNKREEIGVRSAIIFVSTCRSCELLSLLLEQLDLEVAALHSFKSQSSRLSALHKFKSGQVPVLISTDVANRGLDIPTVDLVLNYDIPRYPEDYVHRVGRTARAGRGGLALSFITEKDVDLIHEIETFTGKKLDKFECKEEEVLDNITKVYKARRVATMKMVDDGFDERAKARKAQKWKSLEEKGLRKKRKRGGKPVKSN